MGKQVWMPYDETGLVNPEVDEADMPKSWPSAQIVAALERISQDEHEDGCPVPTTILMRCFCSQKMAKAALSSSKEPA